MMMDSQVESYSRRKGGKYIIASKQFQTFLMFDDLADLKSQHEIQNLFRGSLVIHGHYSSEYF